jgi:site-specific DNA-methyltransferase (adenine-specific)
MLGGMNTYPRLPELGPAEYEALKASVKELGILVPVVRTPTGETIDGRARERAARELGLRDYPVRTLSGLTPEQRWEVHCSLNVQRRQMDRTAKREYVAACLRHAPERSDRWLGELTAADGKTVASVRRELEARAEIPQVRLFRGKDGKSYRFTTVPTESRRHARAAAEALRKLGKDHPARVLKVGTARRLAQVAAHERHRSGEAPEAPPGCRVECCDFRALRVRLVDLIWTDPMWDDRAIWPELGKWAARVLKAGGILAAYTVAPSLPAALEGLGRHLSYRWCASLWRTESSLLHAWRVKSGWCPLVVFYKGRWKYPNSRYMADTFHAPRKEKEFDPMQQSLHEALYFVEVLSPRRGLVADPFAGSFTTAVAALRLGRRFVGCDIVPGKVTGGLKRLSVEACA